MKKIRLILFFLTNILISQACTEKGLVRRQFVRHPMEFINGDLIFTQIGTESDPISSVTEGYRHALLNHLGVVVENKKGTFILEAFPPEVRVTSVPVFLRRSNDKSGNPRYMVGRLSEPYRHLIPAAIEYGLMQRDKPYDQQYLTDEDALYCSELVVDMFKSANGGSPFFLEHPMRFRDKVTGEVLPAWIEYYERFGMEVPEGQPGSNPGDISNDCRVSIYAVQGNMSGYMAPFPLGQHGSPAN